MGAELGQCSLYMENYPEQVPFPDPNEDSRKRSKGLSGLTTIQIQVLVDSILNRENKYPIQLKRYEGPSIGEFDMERRIPLYTHILPQTSYNPRFL